MLAVVGCILSKFYIKPQLLVANVIINRGCILSKFYIKPQQCPLQHYSFCVVSYRNSTSNHNHTTAPSNSLFVVSYRNSTSNHNIHTKRIAHITVVSYRNSTSNHNFFTPTCQKFVVVSYRNSTSNHNTPDYLNYQGSLYLIEILHQTTTLRRSIIIFDRLYLIEILHQTTTLRLCLLPLARCILSKFYIKPQPRRCYRFQRSVVSYRNSTSNHN